MRLPWTAIIGAAALLAIGAAALQAQSGFQDAFRDGMAAFEQRRWAEAAKQFQRAAQLKAESGENVRLYGTRFENYLPQYFLGRALYELGDVSGAVRAFDASEQAGAVKRTRYYQTLQDQRRDARQRVLAINQPTGPTPDPGLPSNPQPLKPDPPKPDPAKPDPAKPDPPKPDPPKPDPPKPSAEALRAADQSIQQADRQRQLFEQTRDLDEMRQIEMEISRLEARARADLDSARQRLDGARRGSLSDLSAVSGLAQSATAGFDRAREVSEGARKRVLNSLISASALYFTGRYSAALTELNKLDYSTGFPGAQVKLFRAASAYALFLTGGQRDAKLQQEAAANVRDCRRLANPGFKPDPKAFSPRFVQFFERTS
jgi:tetratricopeptide (TPR) repeat protein